jgi:hypothetical protein
MTTLPWTCGWTRSATAPVSLKGSERWQPDSKLKPLSKSKVLQGLAVLLQIGSPPRGQATNIVIGGSVGQILDTGKRWSSQPSRCMYCSVLCCVVLCCNSTCNCNCNCIVLYCVVLCSIVLYCIVLHCIVLYCMTVTKGSVSYLSSPCFSPIIGVLRGQPSRNEGH